MMLTPTEVVHEGTIAPEVVTGLVRDLGSLGYEARPVLVQPGVAARGPRCGRGSRFGHGDQWQVASFGTHSNL